jgi:beta-glucosidase
VTILQGIREAAGVGNVLSADWTRPAAVRKAAARAGAVIVAIGEKPYAEWYGDNPKGALEGLQRQLVKAVEASGKPIVLVLVAGRPLMITDLVKSADAFVMAYLPGSEAGHGLADVLFGKVSPRGKLPVSWPARIADVPMVKGVRLSSGTRAKPLFAYGSGLSYR